MIGFLIIVDCGGEICYQIISFFIGKIDKSLDFRIVPTVVPIKLNSPLSSLKPRQLEAIKFTPAPLSQMPEREAMAYLVLT